jgi:MFS family permease
VSDPASQAAADAATASAGVAIAVTGSVIGLQFDSMMIGFIGALVAQTLVPAIAADARRWYQRYLWAFAQLLCAGLLAGILTPVAEALLISMLPGKMPSNALHVAAAGVIGMVAPVIVPLLRNLTNKLASKP